MYEQRCHLVSRVGNKRVPPKNDGTHKGTHGKTEAGGKKSSSIVFTNDRGRNPHIEENQKVGKVAKVKEEIMEIEQFIRIPPIGEKNNGLLYK